MIHSLKVILISITNTNRCLMMKRSKDRKLLTHSSQEWTIWVKKLKVNKVTEKKSMMKINSWEIKFINLLKNTKKSRKVTKIKWVHTMIKSVNSRKNYKLNWRMVNWQTLWKNMKMRKKNSKDSWRKWNLHKNKSPPMLPNLMRSRMTLNQEIKSSITIKWKLKAKSWRSNCLKLKFKISWL